MGAIGLNPIRFDRIGLDPIRINAIKLGVPGAASGTDRPYIDPEVLASLKAVCICYGKSNDDPDRAIVKNLVDPDNPFVISNAAYTEGSGYADKDSPYYGAFVTDGIDDLITSTKTVQEMLGGSNEITVVSLITHISGTGKYNIIGDGGIQVSDYSGQTFMAGTSSSGEKIVELGDKEKLQAVQYTTFDSKLTIGLEDSSYAYYGTFVFNKENVPVDWIHQVIAYFNLDRTLNPDILCNTIKQGITNENHAEFGDRLIDFSGNGRDIQLNNIAWDGDSGIGKYNYPNWKVNVTQGNKYDRIVYYDSINGTYSANFKGITDLYKSYGLSIEIRVNRANTIDFHSIKEDGIYTITPPDDTTSMDIRFGGENVYNASCDITITQIPSHAGALCLDGINDFGKVTGMPIYKDYTFIIDYERISYASSEKWVAGVVSKSHVANQGAFILMTANTEVEPGKQAYSFGGVTSFKRDDFTRALLYQSKYKCGDVDLTVGEGVDSDTLWLGTFRDNDKRFFNGAIYSLMSFPYSMSEFLIERQLKKHKLGTLYPNMVEFRPVIKANANYKITYYQIDSTNTWKSIKVSDYIVIGAKLAFQITFDNDASELKEVVSPQLSGIIVEKRPSNPGYNIYSYITSKSPQKINITIDEYIRFEDIVQPYPVLLRFKDENGNEVSWGGKFRVGSTITRIGSAADSNLLPNIYNIFGLLLNGNQVTSSKAIVEKTMVFKAKSAYIFDNNEPSCILSPRLLRIPNSSYKILGHIPDISGHGNHGKINNSAYAGASGANGYLQNFSGWTKASGVSSTDSVISSSNNLVAANGWIAYVTSGTVVPTFKVEISGIPINGNLRFEGSDQTLVNGVNTIQGLTTTKVSGFYISNGYDNDWSNLRIEQIGEYEGAYCLDGVDDFITIPTLSSGGKQVLMKVNWSTEVAKGCLYDQRKNVDVYEFAIFNLNTNNTGVSVPAYQARNDGKTYIDGILNNNILAGDLKQVLHNITITNELVRNAGTVSPTIGKTVGSGYYTNMALYDFMLFDEISTDEEILNLNKYIGIEPKVELPPYYWDAYGKTNLDADKATIQQRGVAVGDYDITNYNHAYDKMSGYGGYEFAKFDNTLDWYNTEGNDSVEVVSRNGHSITLKRLTGSNFWYFQNSTFRGLISNVIPFKVNSNKNIAVIWDVHGLSISEGKDKSVRVQELVLNPNEDNYTNLKTLNEEELAQIDISTNSLYYLLWFDLSTLAVNEEVTIEMLPLYPNGLVYDGVTDYSENVNIPAFTDYTYIFKRELLNLDKVGGGASLYKGSFLF